MWLLDPAFAGGQVASSRLDTVREEKEGSGGLPPSLSHTPSILRFASLHGPLHNRLSLSPLPRPTTHVHLSLPLSQSSDAHLARLLATNSPVFEFTHRHSNGSNFRCTISEVRLKLRNGHLRGVEYTLSPTDPTASLDDLLSGDSTVTLRNDLSIPSQSHPHGRIARIEVIFASGQKEVWTNGRVPPRYKPSFAMKREERLVELWKKPVSSLRISYAPHAGQGLGTGAVIVGKGKTVHAMRAVFTLEDGEGCRLWARKAGDVESVLREVAEGRAGQSGWKLLFDHGLADRKPVSRSATKPGDIAISQSSLDSTNSNTSIPGTPSETLLLRDDDPGPGRTVAAELVPFPDEEAEGTWVLYGEGTGRVEIDGWVGERERSNEMENQTSYFG